MQIQSRLKSAYLVPLALALGLTACGGGGGGGTNTAVTPPSSAYPPSSTLAGVCTVEGEKKFIRSYIDEKYLWYREVPTVDASLYSSVVDYFKALLVKTPDANGLPKDQFSFAVSTADGESISTGVNQGFGILWTQDALGRQRVAHIEPGSPAADAGMARGGQMVSVVSTNVNNWYSNTAGARIQFWYADRPGGAQRLVEVLARTVTNDPVPLTSTVTSPSGKQAGYLLFNAHSLGAQDKLITAARSLQSNGINELVLDLRYNGGGYLYIAGTLAAMVTGPTATGKVFEALRFNDKRAADSADNIYRFPTTVEYAESAYQAGYVLPRLNLRRVYVLTSEDTCSASESVINGLRGIDVEVVLIGKSTCGKPYGFTRKNNCALSYYPIEFQGTNAKGFGDYSAGFAPTCSSSDDIDHPLGNTQEGMLASALYHLDRGTCAPIASQSVATRIAPSTSDLLSRRLPGGRQLLP